MKRFSKLLLCSLLALSMFTACANGDTTTDATYDKEVDVLVIGGGGAGLSAAIEANDNGAENILVLEAMGQVGGTTFISQGMIAGYQSKVQEAGAVADITYDQMYDNLMQNALYRLDAELTDITVKESGNTIDWLVDRMSVPFKPEVSVGYGPLQMMHVVEGGGPGMLDPYLAALEEAGVEIMTNTVGNSLLTDAVGNVIGAKATDSEGKEITIKANSVIIATGGYANNPELTALLDPEFEGTFGLGLPTTKGEGLIMASNVGAALTHTNHLMAVLKDYEIMNEHNGTSASATVSRFVASPNVVMVGQEGTRFVDEKSGGFMTQELNRPIFQQMHEDNNGYVWAITDSNTVATNEIARGKEMEFIQADTIEELAQLMNVDAANLKTTIDNYNSYVDQGFDPEFGRTALAKVAAPYVAVAIVPCEIITYGGIARNVNAEVIRADGTSINGLYTAGEVAANSAYMGFTISNAITWGRIAGANAANYQPQ